MEDARKLRFRSVKSFFGLLCLSALSEAEMTAYGIMTVIYARFGVLLSPGTVYPQIGYLKKAGLIRTVSLERKKTYALTDKGKRVLQSWLNDFDGILFDLHSFLNTIRKKELSTPLA